MEIYRDPKVTIHSQALGKGLSETKTVNYYLFHLILVPRIVGITVTCESASEWPKKFNSPHPQCPLEGLKDLNLSPNPAHL